MTEPFPPSTRFSGLLVSDQALAHEPFRHIRPPSENIAAVIVEPVQGEGGDNHASPAFFRGVQKLTKQHDVCFIVDEVQTG